MNILGIDPGSSAMGYAVICPKGDSFELLTCNVLKTKSRNPAEKVLELSKALPRLLEEFRPDHAGIEKLYFSKNKKTALEVAQARGVILEQLLRRGIPVSEYGPGTVKLAITGFGGSDKLAVKKMLLHILRLDSIPGDDNASDAVAIALTAAFSLRNPSQDGILST